MTAVRTPTARPEATIAMESARVPLDRLVAKAIATPRIGRIAEQNAQISIGLLIHLAACGLTISYTESVFPCYFGVLGGIRLRHP